VRGIAILLVMVYHFDMYIRQATAGLDHGWLAVRANTRFLGLGWCGVDLFFVLSGFLITGILFDARNDPRYFRNFYARRILRIFPLYYLALIFLAIGSAVGLQLSHSTTVRRLFDSQSWLWWYGTNFKLAHDGVWSAFRGGRFDVGHLWSLAVEEHFYMIWPAVVLALSRRKAMRLCMVLCAISVAARAYCVHLDNLLASYVLTPCRMDSLAIGGWIALAARGPNGLAALIRPAKIVATLAGAAILLIFNAAHNVNYLETGISVTGFTLLALFFGSMIVLTLAAPANSAWSKVMTSRVLRSFGKYSYALYVYHMVIAQMLKKTHLTALSPAWLSYTLVMCCAALISYAIAWLSWHLFEKHFLRLKRFFPHHSPAGPLLHHGDFGEQTPSFVPISAHSADLRLPQTYPGS
jgi:peptidoglycan/LPS O-acetylase OafA/YrhL